MKSVLACCAFLIFACCAPAAAAPARTALGNPFDGYIIRPPASIPHARGMHAAAPVPRPKPAAAQPTSPVAASAGPLVFPPVAPLE